jgi:TRAP-type transport system periplasmic protein
MLVNRKTYPAMRRRIAAFAVMLILLCSASDLGAQTVILRMAANVPAGSPWDLGLRRLGAEFDRVSDGRVKIAFPQSAHVATESDIIQKMRFGFDGALLTTYGFSELYPDSLALSMPNYIRNDAEFDAVLAAVEPLLESRLGDRYVLLALSKGGWVRYFSRSPIVYPSDLADLRISIDANNDRIARILQSAGARAIAGTASDFLLRINSNAVDATCESPIYIASLWSQLRGKIAYMSSFKVAPFIGAIVFNKASWDKVPPELRPRLEQLTKEKAIEISADSAKLEAEAIASIEGIKVLAEPSDAPAKWAQFISERRNGLIAQMFSSDILSAIDSTLAKIRKSK